MPTTIDIVLPRPHPGQRKILKERRRFNVVCCGRRFGKTVLGGNIAIPAALEGHPVGWFAPTYKYLTEVWSDFLRILRPVIARSNGQERRIELITGGVVEFWSLEDPDSGRSRKYRRVIIDEAAKVKNLEACWNEAIRPTLTDLRGEADFLSTPKGHDYFWKAYTWGESADHPDWACWKMPTRSNPYIEPDEVDAAREQLPERVYSQEYLADFIEDSGGVFRKVNDAIDFGRRVAEPPTPRSAHSLGVDLARVQDFTVLTVLDGSGRQVYHDRFNQISWERQIAAILEVARHYNAQVWMDSTGLGDPLFEAVRRTWGKVAGYQFTNASKEALIDNLAMGIEHGRFRLMDVPDQSNELMAYEYELTPSRNVRMNAPEGMHDDCVIALALAAWGLSLPSRTGPILSSPPPRAVTSFRVR
jgi:hypothetical protein